MLKIITQYLNHITYGVKVNLLLPTKYTFKSYLWLIYFAFNIPAFLLFCSIEKVLKNESSKNIHRR